MVCSAVSSKQDPRGGIMGLFDFLKRKSAKPTNGDAVSSSSSPPPSSPSAHHPESAGDAMKPRCAHYAMAHYALRLNALKHPLAVLGVLASPRATELLADLLASCAESCRERGEEPADFTAADLRVHRGRVGQHPCAIVEFPAPQAVTEAYLTAIVLLADAAEPLEKWESATARYFTLEYGMSFERGGTPRTVLCEWTDTSHLNYGDGPPATPEAFAAAIEAKLNQAES
jgi:hypothetical protein